MPSCWVTSPIVTVNGVNKPKVATLFDSHQVNPYAHSSAIYPERSKTWCLSYVTGVDFDAIDNDPECERVFDEVIADQGGKRPSRGAHAVWLKAATGTSAGKLRTKLTLRDADTRGMGGASTRADWLTRLGMAASGDADFRPEGWHV